MSADNQPIGNFDWVRVIDSVDFDATAKGDKPLAAVLRSAKVAARTIKGVAYRLAFFADRDGSNVRPGPARIAVVCGVDYKTAKKVSKILTAAGLLTEVRRGGGMLAAERSHNGSVYRLTIPAELHALAVVRSPGEMDEAVEQVREANRANRVTGKLLPRESTQSRGNAAPVSRFEGGRVTGKLVPPESESRGKPEHTHGVTGSALPTSDLPPKNTNPLLPAYEPDLTPTPDASAQQEEGGEEFDQDKPDRHDIADTIAARYRDRITAVEARRLAQPIAAALQAGWGQDAIVAELDQPTSGLASVAAGLISRARSLAGMPTPAPSAPKVSYDAHRRSVRDEPPCDHLIPGGNIPIPGTLWSTCYSCRVQAGWSPTADPGVAA